MLNSLGVKILAEAVGILRSEKAQDTFEYLLIIGGISVAIIAGVVVAVPGLRTGVISGVCNAINTVVAVTCT